MQCLTGVAVYRAKTSREEHCVALTAVCFYVHTVRDTLHCGARMKEIKEEKLYIKAVHIEVMVQLKLLKNPVAFTILMILHMLYSAFNLI